MLIEYVNIYQYNDQVGLVETSIYLRHRNDVICHFLLLW